MLEPPHVPTPPTVPAGWYPDPWYPGGQRWWDGTAWTGHAATGGAPAEDPAALVRAAAGSAVWLKRALYVVPLAQFGSFAAIFVALRDGFTRLRASTNRDMPSMPFSLGWLAVGQLLGLVALVLLALRMVWLYRATKAARCLGLPVRRDAGLACAGWLIPFVNLWWPYQSVSDLLPEPARGSAKVLRWWVVYLVASTVPTFAVVGVILWSAVGSGTARTWIAGVALLASFALWAVLEVRVVDRVTAVHAELLGSRLGQQPHSYP